MWEEKDAQHSQFGLKLTELVKESIHMYLSSEQLQSALLCFRALSFELEQLWITDNNKALAAKAFSSVKSMYI